MIMIIVHEVGYGTNIPFVLFNILFYQLLLVSGYFNPQITGLFTLLYYWNARSMFFRVLVFINISFIPVLNGCKYPTF